MKKEHLHEEPVQKHHVKIAISRSFLAHFLRFLYFSPKTRMLSMFARKHVITEA